MSPLPEWLTPLPDAAGMRAVDRWAIDDRGVDGLDLMERAGAGVAEAVERLAPDGPVLVVCGKGNNGGDGFVVARLLRQAGRPVEVLLTAPADEVAGDARANLERLPGAAPTPFSAQAVADGDAVVAVDALLGTGFEGEPRGAVAEAIAALNASPVPVVSVDVPSGVNASNGEVAAEAVDAAATVSFHAGKPGLWINPGKGHAGQVETIDIGIPRGAPMDAPVGLIDGRVLAQLPRRTAASTKFTSGPVLVVGGSRGLSGAPTMAARAAMRTGAGYVTACVPVSQQPVLAAATPELMTRPLPEDEHGALSEAGAEAVREAAGRGGALALGPGLGREPGAQALARSLAAEIEIPLVLDADGLNAHAGRLVYLAGRPAPTVLTPHAGELGRLLERDGAQVERARLASVREAAARAGAVVVLKGDDTLIATPDGRVAVSADGTPALATAGTGDVLTGVIAALLAQGVDVFTAAAAGVYIHARAGQAAARRLRAVAGVIAGDVIEQLPAARAGADGGGS